MNKKEFLDSGLLEQYLLGLLDDKQEIKTIEEYIATDADIKAYYNKLQDDMLNLADANAIKPPSNIKEKVLSEIVRRPKGSNIFQNGLWTMIGLLASALLFFGGIKYYQLKDQYKTVQESYVQLEKECSENQASFEKQNQFFANVETNKVFIKNDGFLLSTYYNKKSQLMHIDGFSEGNLPEGKCYYLWGDIDHKMVKLGRLDDPGMVGAFRSFDGAMVSFNVTIEDDNSKILEPDVSQLVGSVTI